MNVLSAFGKMAKKGEEQKKIAAKYENDVVNKASKESPSIKKDSN